MKEVVNNLTGEIIEIPEYDNELVKKEMNAIVTDDLLDNLAKIEYLEEQIKTWKFNNKELIKKVFKENGIKSFKNNYIEITYVEPTIRKSVDTKKLKEAGLYDEFSKDSIVDEQIRIKLKED